MRYLALLLLLALAPGLRAQSTDIILRTDGSETAAKVLAVAPLGVTYQTGADTLTIPTAEVFLIRYANGTREVLTAAAPAQTAPAASSPLTAKAFDQQGRLDAGRHYKANGVFWGSYAATLISAPTFFVGGVAGSLIMGNTRPQEKNFVIPNPALRENPAYMAGYRSRAAKKKLGTAALGFGLGMATFGMASIIMLRGQ